MVKSILLSNAYSYILFLFISSIISPDYFCGGYFKYSNLLECNIPINNIYLLDIMIKFIII